MGCYIYISENDRLYERTVKDTDVNECFQEALKYCPSIMIDEIHSTIKKSFFKKELVTNFRLYHEVPAHDGSAYQARLQLSASGDKRIVIAYLHGIINGHQNTQTK